MMEFVRIVNTALAAIAVVGGVLGWFFRAYMAEWIKNKFSKAVGKELAAPKHELDKELEAYKVALIRELEQLRANIDVNRAIALQSYGHAGRYLFQDRTVALSPLEHLQQSSRQVEHSGRALARHCVSAVPLDSITREWRRARR